MPVIKKPHDAPPAFGGRGMQIVLDRGLIEQLRRWQDKKTWRELSVGRRMKH